MTATERKILERLDAIEAMIAANGDEVLTLPDVCELAKCKPCTVYAATSAKEIRYSRPGTKNLFLRSDVLAWIISRSQGGPR